MDILVPLFQSYGYYLLFLVLFSENTILLGLFVPGETVLLMASALTARSFLEIEKVFAVGALAAFLGQNVGYLVGSRGGRPLLERFGDRFSVDPQRIRTAEDYFARHGGKTVFIGRFAAGIRVFIPLIAGASHMSFGKFFLYTLAAVLVWTAGVTTLGFVLGDNWESIAAVWKNFSTLVLLVIVAGFFGYLYLRRRRSQSE